MVLDYYQLRQQPFGVTPDSRFLYSSATHKEALASVLYAIESRRGFAALIAKPGMGKTTLLHEALGRLQSRARTVFLFQTVATPVEFLESLLADLGITNAGTTLIELQSKLNTVLEEQARSGRPLVVFIDEAQNLDHSVLEMVRMLSNFETSQEKLMQIVLSGQPQLADRLQGADLVQLRQRISILCRLDPLSREEVSAYIHHRLRAAGYSSDKPLFTPSAAALIAKASEGIPRNINNLCFNALSLGRALKQNPIGEDVIREVVADLDLEPLAAARSHSTGNSEPPLHQTSTDRHSTAKPNSGEHSRRLPGLAWAAVAAAIVAIVVFSAGGHQLFRHSRVAASGQRASGQAERASGITPARPFKPALQLVPAEAPAEPESVTALAVPNILESTPVEVRSGETLYRICIEHLGRYNSAVVARVRRLNPWLTDPNHIESGRAILIPVRKSSQNPQSLAIAASGDSSGTGDSQ